MKKRFLTFCFLIISLNMISQELLLDQDVFLRAGFNNMRESFSVVNNEKNELVLFLMDSKKIKSFLYNKNYNLIDTLNRKRPNKKFSTLLGHSADSANYHLFFTNNNKNQFFIESINFTNKQSIGKLLSIKLKDEKYLESISYKNKFYLITIKKMSSFLIIYEFQGNKVINTKQFDFSSYKFDSPQQSNLYDILLESIGPFNSVLKIHKIDNSNPNSLDLTSKENKIYYYNDKLYLTLDNNLKNTKLITINLTNYSHSFNYYNQVKIDCGESLNIKSNSYLFKDKIYQIKGCNQEFCFQITDFNKDTLLKEFRVKKNEKIEFKNTLLIQKGNLAGPSQNSEKELKNTKQFLRKISASSIGVSVNQSLNNLELAIGGFKEVKRSNGGGMMMTPGTSTISSSGEISTTAPTYNYSSTMFSYISYVNSRSVYFKMLLNQSNLNHIEGKVSKNIYDKIEEYDNSIRHETACKTIFKIDDYYVFGYYNKLEEKFYLRKFTE